MHSTSKKVDFKFDNFYMSDRNGLDVSYNITVPVIKVEEVVIDDENIKEEISIYSQLCKKTLL